MARLGHSGPERAAEDHEPLRPSDIITEAFGVVENPGGAYAGTAVKASGPMR